MVWGLSPASSQWSHGWGSARNREPGGVRGSRSRGCGGATGAGGARNPWYGGATGLGRSPREGLRLSSRPIGTLREGLTAAQPVFVDFREGVAAPQPGLGDLQSPVAAAPTRHSRWARPRCVDSPPVVRRWGRPGVRCPKRLRRRTGVGRGSRRCIATVHRLGRRNPTECSPRPCAGSFARRGCRPDN